MEENEYRKILLESHSKNQKFIDNNIFLISFVSILYILQLGKHIPLFLMWSFSLYSTIIIMQFISCLFSKKACDLSLNKNKRDKGNKIFDMAEILDKVIFTSFIFTSLSAIIYVLFFR